MNRKLVFTVGNPIMGDDAAGPLLAYMLKTDPVAGWDVIDGGSVPENSLYLIREMKADQVLLVDAADMDLAPGEIRLIGPDRIDDPFLMSTHTLPLSYLVQAIREFVPDVQLLGIQPGVVGFGYPVSREVKRAVEQIHRCLKHDAPDWRPLEPSMINMDWKST
ncbi:MAG: hydrogenase maturation peptidase HycI [Bacteroidota bacterium]